MYFLSTFLEITGDLVACMGDREIPDCVQEIPGYSRRVRANAASYADERLHEKPKEHLHMRLAEMYLHVFLHLSD